MAATFLPAPAFAVDDPQRLAKTDLTRCILLMNTGPAHLSYAVFDPRDQYFITLKGYYFDNGREDKPFLEIIEQCFHNDKILFTAFNKIRISFDNPEFTLIPGVLFDPALKKEYLSFLHPDYPGRSFFSDRMDLMKVVNVYAVDKDVAGYLKKEFRSAWYYHTETAFLTSLTRHEEKTGNRVYVRILPGRITVTVLADGELLMMQPYMIKQGMDALYYVLNALRQLDILPGKVQVFLSGEVEEDSKLYKELQYEIPEVSWLKHPAVYRYAPAFGEYPDHHFYNLIALASCG